MPGFGPVPEMGLFSVLWLVVFFVVVVLVWRGRRQRVPGTAIVLKKFRINQSPAAGPALEIRGRGSGLVSWVLNLMHLEPEVDLFVTDTEISFRSPSLSGISHIYVPLGKVNVAICGYQRSILALAFGILFAWGFVFYLLSALISNRSEASSNMAMALGFMVLAAVAALVYYLSKRIAIGVESSSAFGVTFKRSVVENVSVDLPEALQAIAVVHSRILAAQTAMPGVFASATPLAAGYSPTPISPAAPVRRCPKCSEVNPPETQFCENCGCELLGPA